MCSILTMEQFSIKTKSRKDINFKNYTKGKEKTELRLGPQGNLNVFHFDRRVFFKSEQKAFEIFWTSVFPERKKENNKLIPVKVFECGLFSHLSIFPSKSSIYIFHIFEVFECVLFGEWNIFPFKVFEIGSLYC